MSIREICGACRRWREVHGGETIVNSTIVHSDVEILPIHSSLHVLNSIHDYSCLSPQVSLHDLRTLRIRKTLCIEEGISRWVSLAFSHDSTLLLALDGAPIWSLVLWNWMKARPLAKIRASESLPIYEVRRIIYQRGRDIQCMHKHRQIHRVI